MLTNREFARRFKQIRMQSGASQIETAKAIYRNENHIKNIESGERQADYSTLVLLADYFNVSVDYLLNRTNNPIFNEK